MSVPLAAIDARMTEQMSVGMKTYVRELVKRLPRIATDLRFIAVINEDIDAHPDMGVLRIDERLSRNGSFGELFGLAKVINRMRPAMTHYPTPYAPRWSPYPYAYTIHDLIHRVYPRYHSWKIPPYYAFVVAPVARSAAAVIVPTRATVPDVEKYLGVSPHSVRPVAMGVSDAFRTEDMASVADVRERFGLAQPFFLYAGNHRLHKNLETLVSAWQRMEGACDLAITEDGPFGFNIDRYVRADGRIVRVGHVGERDLVGLYAASAGAVQPSLYEGFGLSVVEAMAAGAPCIVAETPALLEVAGGAALTFPPTDADALAKLMTKLLRDPVEVARLRAAGFGRAASFSWDETARGTAAVYREVIGHAS
jgi:glycosyltransferase involved in cell wall biosynthesis